MMITDAIKGYALGGVAVLLAISLLGNLFLYHEMNVAQDEKATATEQRKQAQDAANQCSASVDRLEQEANRQLAAAAEEVKAAKARETDAGKRAQNILSTPPTRPNDDCGSATDRARAWLKDRS